MQLMEFVSRSGVYSRATSKREPKMAGQTGANYRISFTISAREHYVRDGISCERVALSLRAPLLRIQMDTITWKYIPQCSAEVSRWNEAVILHERRHKEAYQDVERESLRRLPFHVDVCDPNEQRRRDVIESKKANLERRFADELKAALENSNDRVHEMYGENESCSACEKAPPC